jgi:hypothetical protein
VQGTMGRTERPFVTALRTNFREGREDEVPLIGLLGSSPLWSFQKFASGRRATSGCTSFNVTFAGA